MGTEQRLLQLYGEMVVLLQEEERICKETEKVLARAKAVIDPRNQFNKWLKSSEGQAWKEKQFEYQERKCAYCGGEILETKHADVHHVLPLKNFGSTANKPENYKLLHPICNREIATKVVDFLF